MQRLMVAEQSASSLRDDAQQMQLRVTELEEMLEVEKSRASAWGEGEKEGELPSLRMRCSGLERMVEKMEHSCEILVAKAAGERSHKIGLALSRQARVTSCQIVLRWRFAVSRNRHVSALAAYMAASRTGEGLVRLVAGWRESGAAANGGAGQEELAKAVRERDKARTALVAMQSTGRDAPPAVSYSLLLALASTPRLARTTPRALLASPTSALSPSSLRLIFLRYDPSQPQRPSVIVGHLDRLLASLRHGSEAGLFPSGQRHDIPRDDDLEQLAEIAADKVGFLFQNREISAFILVLNATGRCRWPVSCETCPSSARQSRTVR